jgi:carboxylesterase type B
MKPYLFVLLVLAAFALVAYAQDPTVVVETPFGKITGHLTEGKTGYAFRGIPFVNQYKRWEHSTVARQPFGSYDAKYDAPGCPQQCQLPEHTCPEVTDELTCLGMNIFVPVDFKKQQKLPVMNYWAGGNYFQGSNSTPLYNGTTIASLGNVIVVVPNYRLGILGYYRDDENGIFGNYGVVDQLNSLKWIQQNIAAFSGDVNNVTVFGQSAGAGSTSIALISKYFDGLFHKAIIHSNPFAIPLRSVKTKPGLVKAFRKHAGCNTVDCLKALPTDKIIEAQVATATDLDAASGNMLSVFIPFNPYIETSGQEQLDPQYPGLVPYQPHEAFLRGLVKNVPIIIGLVTQESDVFIYEAFDKPLDDTGYSLFGWLIFGDEKSKKIIQKFPPIKPGDNRDGLCEIGSEFIFHCATRNATRGALSTSVKAPLFTYVFDHQFQFNTKIWEPNFSICNDRVCHAGDLPALWNSAQWLYDYSKGDQELSNNVDYYWTNFAWTSNPNQGPNAAKLKVQWDNYQKSGTTLYLQADSQRDTSKMARDVMTDDCDWWDKEIGYFL